MASVPRRIPSAEPPGIYGAATAGLHSRAWLFVTPALLGSPKETMIAQTIMLEATQTLDWETASAAGTLLLIVTNVMRRDL